MKKFFTLCLAFMLASLLNVNAADTYTLVGDLNGWNTSAEGYNFTYVQATDSYVLEGVTLKGEFKIVKNNSWDNPAFGSNGNSVPLDAAYIMWNTDAGNMVMIDGKDAVYNDCKLELKVLSAKNASLRITSSTAMQSSFDTRADVWCVAGSFSNDNWGDANEMTALGNGVYEFWSTELPSEFKFKAKGNWDVSLGIHNEIKNTPIMGFDNAVDNGGANISLKTDKAYDLYRYTLTVRGWVASFRVDGYKQATQPVTVFYESFDACNSTGGNDGLFSGQNTANGSFTPDNDGWVVASKNGGNKCGKFGSGSKSGELTSPALGLTGDATLTFKAAPWGTDGTSLGLSISSGQLSESSLTMTADQWTEYTIKITGATPDATLTFTPAKRFFLDEVKVIQGDASADMKAAGISLNGVMKDAETAYYHHTLANPTVTVTLPAGATHMDIEVDNNGWIDEYLSAKGKTEDYTIEFYSTGNFTINVTAYGEGVYSVASKDIAIETVSSVYTFDELINKGEGATCYINFSPIVVAHVGKYLYLDGYDMWEGIRSSALVYASLDKTYNKGDVLQGFIATVSYYNGNPQLTPLTTSLGDVFGMSEPYVYEVEAGDAWKAFAVEANVNKYVRVKNAPVTADAVDGVAAYTKNLGVNMPEDLNKKYDVEGFINNFKGTIQIQPISFTVLEEKIEPFTYTEIVPANNAEVTSLSEIKITFPYEVAYDATVAMGVLVMDGENMITPTVAVEGNVATLTFDAITAYGSKPSLMVMAGAFKEASGVGCQQIMASWTIPTPPITYDLAPVKVTPTSGSTVEKLERITLQVSEDVYDCRWAAQSYGNDFITVTDDKGNSYNGKLGYTSYTEYYYLYVENATAPGTYTITVKEGVFGDEQYLKKFEKGHANPEFTLTYTIKGAALAAPTVDPANGAEIESPSTITLTFAEAVTVNAEAGAITLVRNSDAAYDKQEAVVTISEDGLTATLTCKPVYPSYEPKWYVGETYTMSIPAGYFVATSGAANEALSYSWKLVAPKFTYVAVDPAQGDVTELSEILISFAQKTYGYGSNPTLNLVDADGNVVTTASTVRSTDANGNWFAIKATLKDKVTTPGTYTLVVPENSFTDVDFGDSGNKSAAFDLTWTVMEPDPNTYTLALNADPASGSTVSALDKITFTPGAGVMMFLATDEAKVANWAKVTDANGNSYNSKIDLSGQYYALTIEGATAPGTYTVVIPKKSFYDALNATNFNDEIVLTYTIEAAPAVEDYTPVVTPAAGEVTAAEIVNTTIVLPAKFASFDKTIDDYYNEIYIVYSDGKIWSSMLGKVTTSEDGLSINIAWDYTPKADTEYSLIIPAGYIVLENGAKNLETKIVYTVKAAEVEVEDFTPTVSPAAGNITVDEMDVTVITFDSPIATFNDSNVRYIKAAGGNVWFFGTSKISEDRLTLTLNWNLVKGNYPVGTSYTLDLPAGCIVLENGAKNLETRIDYTLVEPVVDFTPAVSPAAGEITVDQMNETVITFDTPIASFDGNNVRYIKAAGGNVWFFGTSKISEDKLTLTLTWDLVKGNYPVGTSYTLDLPAGCIVLENGAKNLETRIDYTLVEPTPVVEDFTPVVNPAAGNVTKEQIKTTVLSFESPIASFDNSDVRYAKNFGSVWCSVAGSYTISEDKLSLTINWDFSPEVGLGYTLELPAGCIVLENGAKNLFTQVAYTVVAGPKDLAEFVVPAGMNGYVNYDETDVNAWAPEFPFTVSTTAYNTVAFAAELPSLPAGITAMEVIDENGEVIATLNQDGVAPLADGEIYYVKGETTKEYVDGAELKFRFRFTHLGVSETIQFSYKVAGGNITSIADIELNGNVIVRGNDIIAPQGAAIFTVSGIRVPAEGLAPGVYVVVLGNQAVKVMVK